MNDVEKKACERLRRNLAVVRTLDGEPVALVHVDELPPYVGEALLDVLARRAIATLADWEDA